MPWQSTDDTKLAKRIAGSARSSPLAVVASGVLPTPAVSEWVPAGRGSSAAALSIHGSATGATVTDDDPSDGRLHRTGSSGYKLKTDEKVIADFANFTIRTDVTWTEGWDQRHPITMAFTDAKVENEYLRWMFSVGPLGPIFSFVLMLLIIASRIVTIICHPTIMSGITLAANTGAAAIGLYLLLHKPAVVKGASPSCPQQEQQQAAVSSREPRNSRILDAMAEDDNVSVDADDPSVWAANHERIAVGGYGFLLAIVMVAAPSSTSTSPDPPMNDEYLFPVIVLVQWTVAVVSYDIRFSIMMWLMPFWVACLIAGRFVAGSYNTPAMMINYCVFTVMAAIPFILFSALKDSEKRARFCFIVKAQLALNSSRLHESVMWDIVQRVVPLPLLLRVRTARTWKSIAVLDHASKACVSVATVPYFTKWTGVMNPKDVVLLICRVFSIFDTVLQTPSYALHGITSVLATGDCFVVVGGVMGAGRRARNRPGKASFARRLVPEESDDVASRRLALVVEAAQQQLLATRGLHPSPNFGVAVGVGYGDCWGGLNGRVLHHRYVLHGIAIDEAMAASGVGVPNQLLFGANAADMIAKAASLVPFARELMQRNELVPSANAAQPVKLLLPKLGSSSVLAATGSSAHPRPSPNTSQHPASTGSVTRGAQPLTTFVDPGDEESVVLVSEGTSVSTANSACMIDLIDPDEADVVVAATHEAEEQLRAMIDDADASAMRDLVSTNSSRLSIGDRASGVAAVRRVVSQTKQVPVLGTYVNDKTERAFIEHAAKDDEDTSTLRASATIAAALAFITSFVIDHSFVSHISMNDALPLGMFASTIVMSVIRALFTRSASYLVPNIVVAILSTLIPSSLLMGVQLANNDTLIGGTPSNLCVFAVIILVCDSKRIHWICTPFLFGVGVFLPFLAVGQFILDKGVTQFIVTWTLAVILLSLCCYYIAHGFRQRFASAMLASLLLDESLMKVKTREKLLEGLLPKHLVKNVASMLQATAFDVAAKDAVAGRPANGMIPELRYTPSPFSHEPHWVEAWEQLAVAVVQFHSIHLVPAPMTTTAANDDDDNRSDDASDRGSLLRGLVESSRDLVDSLRVLKAVDSAVVRSHPQLRVIRVLGDTIAVAFMPAAEELHHPAATYIVTFLRHLAELTARPFTAGATVDLAFGAVIGAATYQHVVMGEAVRRAEAVLLAAPRRPDGTATHSSAWATEVLRNTYAVERSALRSPELPVETDVVFGSSVKWRVRNLGSVAVFPVILPPPNVPFNDAPQHGDVNSVFEEGPPSSANKPHAGAEQPRDSPDLRVGVGEASTSDGIDFETDDDDEEEEEEITPLAGAQVASGLRPPHITIQISPTSSHGQVQLLHFTPTAIATPMADAQMEHQSAQPAPKDDKEEAGLIDW